MGGIIKPIALTRFWHRRILEVAFLIVLSIIAIFLWNLISNNSNILTVISLPTMILASTTAVVCLVAYFINIPSTFLYTSLAAYVLSAATYATLIIYTGNTGSPFVALWALVCIFAGVFGLFGTLPVLIATAAFTAVTYIDHRLSGPAITVIVFCAVLPLIATNFLWIGAKSSDNQPDKKTNNNHNEFNELASKSEVVINAIGDGVMAIDSKGAILLINPAGLNLLGWSEQEALSLSYKSVLKLVDSKDEQLVDATDPIQQALNTNQEIRNNKLVLLTKTGKKVMISLVISPVGEVGSGVIIVFRDITKEKAEEREQAEFISTASHEMRTPVASIEGFLGLALNPQTAQIDTRAQDYLTKAHAAAQHLGRLFQDLLDISKSEDGRMQNNPKVTNIVPLVHDIIQGLQNKAAEKGLNLIYKPMPDGGGVKVVAPSYSVNVDNDHVREIIENLVENAIKYTLNGEVVIDVTGDEEHVIISVKDSGIGIPAEDMPHLFQKFYRVDNKDTREIGGTGLGLYLSRKLAEMLGGRVWAESEYGKGSTFYLELPRISSQEAERLKEQEVLAARIKAANGQPATPTQTVSAVPQSTVPKVIEPVMNKVPRGEALTPEQKAAYVARQSALAQQQVASQPQSQSPQPQAPVAPTPQSRPQNVTVPQRVLR